MELKPYGDRGLLLADLSDAERSALLAKLESALPAGCEEYVVGYESVLFICSDAMPIASLDARNFCSDAMPIASKPSLCSDVMPITSKPTRSHTVEVIYNGADLESVAKACSLTVEQVIELHSAPIYTVRMLGFSPGFPYLEGLDPRLHLERLASPRNQIEPGAVAIGGSHAGIYSVASPGGWHLLGHTDFTLFDLTAARQSSPNPKEVFALSPGDQVRFQPKEIR